MLMLALCLLARSATAAHPGLVNAHAALRDDVPVQTHLRTEGMTDSLLEGVPGLENMVFESKGNMGCGNCSLECDKSRAGSTKVVNTNFTDKTMLPSVADDIRILRAVPESKDASTWKNDVVVVIEGLFLTMGNGGVPNTHYYNVVNIIVPHILRYVYGPLVASGRLNTTTVHLHKERLPPSVCHPVISFADGDQKHRLTMENLERECRSGLEMLPEMIPDMHFSFVDGLPFCNHFNNCPINLKNPAMMKSATILYVPRVQPYGNSHSLDACAFANLYTQRAYYRPKTPPAPANTVTVIVRNALTSGNYAYERQKRPVDVMKRDALDLLRQRAEAAGFVVNEVQLEQLTFAEQLALFQQTAILVGLEGAGLSNMAFLSDPVASKVVVEFDGRDPNDHQSGHALAISEFPTLASVVGVPLFVQRIGEQGVTTEVVQQLGNIAGHLERDSHTPIELAAAK